jgi:hypothetical protein
MIKRICQLIVVCMVGLMMAGVIGGEVVAFSPNQALCSESGGSSTEFCAQANPNPIFGPTGVVTKAVRLLSIVTGIASVIIIMLAGLQYMIAEGDSSKVSSAKNTLLYALVGLVITIVARSIVAFVLNKV